VLTLLLFFLQAGAVFAAQEEPSRFMEIWAIVWRIINFLILAIIIFKVAKQPLKKFLSDRRSEIDTEIKEAEKMKTEAEDEYGEAERKMAELDQQAAEITALIEDQGRSQKEKFIQEATKTAERMLQEAQEHSRFELRKARHEFREELVEMAIDLAEQKIREKINQEDQENLVMGYIQKIAAQA
jgi:F-type H+-transporting ATPase subunit b